MAAALGTVLTFGSTFEATKQECLLWRTGYSPNTGDVSCSPFRALRCFNKCDFRVCAERRAQGGDDGVDLVGLELLDDAIDIVVVGS
jgi:hypothetical protein